ncbi:glycoside hydrolase family 28 protein [Coraliomargarita sp. SDUM461003]|uniref:Glycoside hydrolase family 28 protein n=1 Tax=Thalassobacterium maritimum TaxID=3041265 RepID=A0ABU1AQA4_9BACT|nr:glycoside hydrolase family 28 protein [Coraliomargarita sp. SDUM461003]MDQ8206344.1 glycoside hydrolase family 28 protein [Coraliomargarita sp. SDUM461003]
MMTQDLSFDLPRLPRIPNFAVNICSHGAVPGEEGLITQSIAAAIEACASAGGGRVVVPKGLWLTGPIHLCSHVELHLEHGAELRFSTQPEDYLPVVFQQRGGIRCYNYSPFIYAHECHDIAITGKGVLDGQGSSWWPWKQQQPGMVDLFKANAERRPVEQRVYGTPEHGVRPPFIQTINCRNVLIEGLTLLNSPAWTIHPVWCEDLTVRHVKIKNPADAHNTDGIDPDGCRKVLIEHCRVDTGDDGICIKSGREYDGWESGRPCENILIRHCEVRSAHGGIVIGSEMAAGVRNVFAHNCCFNGTEIGIRLKTRMGRGGYIRDVRIEQIKMLNIRDDAILITMRYNGEQLDAAMAGSLAIPTIENIALADIECEPKDKAIRLFGLEGHPLRNISLARVSLQSPEQIVQEFVTGLEFCP